MRACATLIAVLARAVLPESIADIIAAPGRERGGGVLGHWYSRSVSERFADHPPRPLADAPIGPLQHAIPELARDWIAELVAARALTELGTLDLATAAEVAPELVAALITALSDDDALAQLRRGGEDEKLIVAACVAVGSADRPAEALELLRRVIWAAALDELRRPPAELVAALADRLAHICAMAAAAAGAVGPRAAEDARQFVVRDARTAGLTVVGESEDDGRAVAGESEDDGAWEAELTTALADRTVGSLLLVDIDGHERLGAADGLAALRRAEKAIKRRHGEAALVRERLGRYWILSPASSEHEALGVAQRLADAVAGGEGHLGVALTASIGFALQDPAGAGHEAAQALLGRAEEAMLSARAGGVGIDSR